MSCPELQQVDMVLGNCRGPGASQLDVSPVSSPSHLGSICCKCRRRGWGEENLSLKHVGFPRPPSGDGPGPGRAGDLLGQRVSLDLRPRQGMELDDPHPKPALGKDRRKACNEAQEPHPQSDWSCIASKETLGTLDRVPDPFWCQEGFSRLEVDDRP